MGRGLWKTLSFTSLAGWVLHRQRLGCSLWSRFLFIGTRQWQWQWCSKRLLFLFLISKYSPFYSLATALSTTYCTKNDPLTQILAARYLGVVKRRRDDWATGTVKSCVSVNVKVVHLFKIVCIVFANCLQISDNFTRAQINMHLCWLVFFFCNI